MRVEYIVEFVAVAENCNLMEVADHLYMSPASLSKHINQLELDLGTQLFSRTSRKLILNEQGQQFLPYARQIATAYQNYMFLQDFPDRSDNNELAVFVTPASNNFKLIEFLSSYQKFNPYLKISIREFRSDSYVERLKSGNCHVAAVFSGDYDESVFSGYTFGEERLVALLPASFQPEGGRSVLSLEDLKERSFLPMEDFCLFNAIMKALRQASFEPKVKSRDKLYTPYNLCESFFSDSYTLLPQHSAEAHMKLFTQKILSMYELEPGLTIPHTLIFLTKAVRKQPLQNFLNFYMQRSL